MVSNISRPASITSSGFLELRVKNIEIRDAKLIQHYPRRDERCPSTRRLSAIGGTEMNAPVSLCS